MNITEALFHVAPGIVEAAAPDVEQALKNLATRSPAEQASIAKQMRELASTDKVPPDMLNRSHE